MLAASELYEHMARVSQRYNRLKKLSFNRQGEIEPKSPADGDPMTLNSRDGAAFLVLDKLNAALG